MTSVVICRRTNWNCNVAEPVWQFVGQRLFATVIDLWTTLSELEDLADIENIPLSC